MTKDQFEKFLDEKARATKEAELVDWESQKREWLNSLSKFYSTIEKYLAPYKQSGKLKVEKSSVPLTEDHIGTYQADSMTLFRGSDPVTLEPVGTLIIGGKGRVDMKGPAGTVKFILTGKHSNGIRISFEIVEKDQRAKKEPASKRDLPEEFVWKITTPPPKIQFIELTQESFFSALTEIVNG